MIKSLRASLGELFPRAERRSGLLWLVLGLAALLAVGFTLYTGLAWEDFFITYRYSQNLAAGHGLVYNLGERVQGFTSPINTLLPALFACLFRAPDYRLPLRLYSLVSLAALLFGFAAGGCLLARNRPRGSLARALSLGFVLLAGLEIKTVAYAMSGQEAGFMIAFLLPALALAVLGWEEHALLGGVLWAGLIYTRPDGCVYIGGIALAAFVFAKGDRRALLRAVLRSAGICAVLYLPWFLFTWIYYGTPVPHTLVAKNHLGVIDFPAFHIFAPILACFDKFPSVLCWALAPIYDWLNAGHGTWPPWTHDLELALELFVIAYWLMPGRDRAGRMASLLCLVLVAYQTYVIVDTQFSPWYYPPLACLSLFTIASAAASWAGLPRARLMGSLGGLALFAAGLILVGFVFYHSLYPLRIKQRIIENKERTGIGLWLKDHAQPGDTVYLEPLGYIGYYSQCHMLDWPGMVTPASVEVRRQLPITGYVTWGPVAEVLHPTWILARPGDTVTIQNSPILSAHYEMVRCFDVTPEIIAADPHGILPGMGVTYAETEFYLYHRKN